MVELVLVAVVKVTVYRVSVYSYTIVLYQIEVTKARKFLLTSLQRQALWVVDLCL